MFSTLREFRRERAHRRLVKLGTRLHVPIPEAFLGIEVRDRNGNVTYSLHRRSHSYVRNMYVMLNCTAFGCNPSDNSFGSGKLCAKRTNEALEYSATQARFWDHADNLDSRVNDGFLFNAGDDNAGILIGTGDTAESFEDYTLYEPIASGEEESEMSYAQSNLHDITWTVGTLTMANEYIRYFNNNSGAAITVKETALVGELTGMWLLFLRDLLDPEVEIADEAQLKVTYSQSFTYPE